MENLLESIERAIGGIQFSTKQIDTDEFTREKSEEACIVQYLYGCRSFYTIPYGGIMMLPKNQWIFELACIHYMKLNEMIPMKFVSGLSNIIKVKRTSGKIQDACIDPLNGIVYNKKYNDFLVRCNLMENDSETPNIYSGIVKSIRLSEVMELNNIYEINVSVPNIINNYANNEDMNDYEPEILEIQDNSINTITGLINNFNVLNKDKKLKINVTLWV